MANGASTGVSISVRCYNNVLGATDPTTAVRHMGQDLFSAEVLATHSLLGARSPYPKLDLNMVESMKSHLNEFSKLLHSVKKLSVFRRMD